jgi:hypothetical protein
VIAGDGGPSVLEVHAAWTLVAAFAVSLAYEVWRATAKAGTSRHDSMRVFLTQDLLLYVMATIVIGLLFAGVGAAAWVGLAFCCVFIVVSIAYYNPRIMVERAPGLIDWAEDLVYTGLLFVAAALLLYEVQGRALG